MCPYLSCCFVDVVGMERWMAADALLAMRCLVLFIAGASAVGLTASVHRDPITREWTLEVRIERKQGGRSSVGRHVFVGWL